MRTSFRPVAAMASSSFATPSRSSAALLMRFLQLNPQYTHSFEQ